MTGTILRGIVVVSTGLLVFGFVGVVFVEKSWTPKEALPIGAPLAVSTVAMWLYWFARIHNGILVIIAMLAMGYCWISFGKQLMRTYRNNEARKKVNGG